MTSVKPGTAAGRRIWEEKPIGWTGQDWRAAILAIEQEAADAALKALRAELDEAIVRIGKTGTETERRRDWLGALAAVRDETLPALTPDPVATAAEEE